MSLIPHQFFEYLNFLTMIETREVLSSQVWLKNTAFPQRQANSLLLKLLTVYTTSSKEFHGIPLCFRQPQYPHCWKILESEEVQWCSQCVTQSNSTHFDHWQSIPWKQRIAVVRQFEDTRLKKVLSLTSVSAVLKDNHSKASRVYSHSDDDMFDFKFIGLIQ